jgi:hypothetical protein
MLQHTLSEIKKFSSKVYCPVTRLQNINRALAEILTLDASDDMYDYLTNRYLQQLDGYHVNGRSGSLLPKEEALQTAVDQAIAAANAAYAVYAQLIPAGFGADANPAAVVAYSQARAALREVAI